MFFVLPFPPVSPSSLPPTSSLGRGLAPRTSTLKWPSTFPSSLRSTFTLPQRHPCTCMFVWAHVLSVCLQSQVSYCVRNQWESYMVLLCCTDPSELLFTSTATHFWLSPVLHKHLMRNRQTPQMGQLRWRQLDRALEFWKTFFPNQSWPGVSLHSSVALSASECCSTHTTLLPSTWQCILLIYSTVYDSNPLPLTGKRYVLGRPESIRGFGVFF